MVRRFSFFAGGLTIALAFGVFLPGFPIRAEAKDRPTAQPHQLASEDWPQPAPKLIGTPDDWLNTNGKSLQIKKGTVYLIDFWEYTCVNCLRTLPYLKEWHKRYAKDGLVIIGIHTPEFAFAKEHDNVAHAVKDLGITWPVLIDSEYANWQAFNNSFWPRKYFINAKGLIVADHAGEGDYQNSEKRIQQLLKQANPNLTFPKVFGAVRDTDKPGAVCYPTTPEIYAGERGFANQQHGNIPSYATDTTLPFTDTGSHEDGKIYLEGEWKMERESLRHARTSDNLKDYAALKYHALEANAVLKPEGGKPFRVYITQDGNPIARADKTDDTQYDEKGRSYILVDQPRMYRLAKNARFGSHELKLLPASSDFGLYSFTFSSCEIR